MRLPRRSFLRACGGGALAARALAGAGRLKITDAKAIRTGGYLYYKLFTDVGVTGVGEPSPSNSAANAEYLERSLKPLLVGEDAFDVEKLWEKMYLGTYKVRGQGVSMAISGVDIALHDLIGKALGVPVYKLLGGRYRERIRMYASYTSRERTAAEQARLCAQAVERGFTAAKIKIAARQGFDSRPIELDRELVRECRKAIGDKTELMVDANSGYSVPTAIRIGRYLEQQNVAMFEEPVPYWDYEGTASVRAALDLPVSGGEQDHTRYDFQKMIAAGAVDIVQADVTKAGGFSECRKIAALADAAGLGYTPHNTSHRIGLYAMLHLVAATPCCRGAQEFVMEPAREQPWLAPQGGYITVPDKPGLGIDAAI